MPDVHLVWDGRPFWMELKVSKGNAVNLSPHQVAWNMAYFCRGGTNFILVRAPRQKLLYLFEGDQGPALVGSGLSGVGSGSGAEGQSFKDLASLYSYLDTYLDERYGRGPKAPHLSVVR